MTNTHIEHDGIATEYHLAKAFLAKMSSELQAIRKFLSEQQFDIDEWKYEQSATIFQPLRDYDGPVVIESILAVFPTASTSVQIALGAPGRIIPVTSLTPGFFFADSLRIQLGQDDWPRNMTIAPAGTGYIQFSGYADRKVIDHA